MVQYYNPCIWLTNSAIPDRITKMWENKEERQNPKEFVMYDGDDIEEAKIAKSRKRERKGGGGEKEKEYYTEMYVVYDPTFSNKSNNNTKNC